MLTRPLARLETTGFAATALLCFQPNQVRRQQVVEGLGIDARQNAAIGHLARHLRTLQSKGVSNLFAPMTDPLRRGTQALLPSEFRQQEQTEQQSHFIALALPSPGIRQGLERFIQRVSWFQLALTRFVARDQGGHQCCIVHAESSLKGSFAYSTRKTLLWHLLSPDWASFLLPSHCSAF